MFDVGQKYGSTTSDVSTFSRALATLAYAFHTRMKLIDGALPSKQFSVLIVTPYESAEEKSHESSCNLFTFGYRARLFVRE